MNPGSAAMGFLLVVGLVMHFGWPAAAIIGIPLLFDLLVGRGIQSNRQFRYLDPLEQALRRASQGFAVMVFALLATVVPYVWAYGWREFLTLWPWFVRHPDEAWPLALPAAAFVVGFVRFRAGVRRAAGARDEMRGPKGLLKCITGLAIVGYLTVTYPWGIDPSRMPGSDEAVFFGIALVYAAGLWSSLVGGVRFILLTIGGGAGLSIARTFARRRNAPLRPAQW